MKSKAREDYLPSVVQYEFYEEPRLLFVRKENKNNDVFSTNRLLSASPRQRRATSDTTHQKQAAYALLHLPQRKDVLFSFKSKRKYM